ncbi:transmembrane protein 208 [Sitodiplosis mosellana]|uniref:transmembrane protein 208 n=1 Tax=Sitodiplosis mosellana TaxID=263140 RepID=UPI002445320C|nr:transmembrane protein 208 [Sitodiplosis mosellana]
MAPQKGKQGTKGAKQIVEENSATLKFYQYMAAGSTTIFFIINFLFFEFTGIVSSMAFISVAIMLGSYQFMAFMSKAKYSESGMLLDSGSDLNMEGGIAENVKDLIILTSGTQVLSLISNWFWILLLLAPVRAIWMLWGSVIKPWLSQRNEQPEVDEKKQKKLERKMKREQKFR